MAVTGQHRTAGVMLIVCFVNNQPSSCISLGGGEGGARVGWGEGGRHYSSAWPVLLEMSFTTIAWDERRFVIGVRTNQQE